MTPCIHHWLCDERIVDMKIGAVCKRCGEERQFPAYIPNDRAKNARILNLVRKASA